MSTQPHLNSEPQDTLGRRLTSALETPRPFTVPANFAARTAAVAHALPTPALTRPRASFTTLAIRAAFVVLAFSMVAVAAWAHHSPDALLLGTEIALALEFVALTTWLSLRTASTP